MSVITAIKSQRNGKRVNIFLDGKFGFGLDIENFLKLKLKVEQNLTDEEVIEIIKKGEFQKVYEKILRFASLRPRSEKEYKIWFTRHKVSSTLHKELFERLRHLDLLDDEKFTIWWIEQRSLFRPKGIRALKLELKEKGIDKEIIDKALTENAIDEVKMAVSLLEKKKYLWKKMKGAEAKVKIGNFLARRGFSWQVINKILKEFKIDADQF